jgi:glycosyltransferase involved in cell wall biosynthesis
MIKIATVVGAYLPGYKFGGPIRSLANMVDWLGDEFEFLILTADRDLGDPAPYRQVKIGQWQQVGKARVYYFSFQGLWLPGWKRLLCDLDYDLLYLNSIFHLAAISTMSLQRLGQIPLKPTIIAPRGSLSAGAFQIKQTKKSAYINLAKLVGLYRYTMWQATTCSDANDIQSLFASDIQGGSSEIIVASDLPAQQLTSPRSSDRELKDPGVLRVVFLSRITRKKNLDFALRLLSEASGQINLDIFGPIEDPMYWKECVQLMHKLPPNIVAVYRGVVTPDKVNEVLSRYHVFFMPTRSENFGYAILEALSAGCLALISDQTPWRDLEPKGAGWALPLSAPELYLRALSEAITMDGMLFQQKSRLAHSYATTFASSLNNVQATRQLFLHALENAP